MSLLEQIMNGYSEAERTSLAAQASRLAAISPAGRRRAGLATKRPDEPVLVLAADKGRGNGEAIPRG